MADFGGTTCGGFRGRVFSGVGHGSFYVSIYARNLKAALGYTPFPGTLNIRLEDVYVGTFSRCLERAPRIRVDPPRIPGERLAVVVAAPVEVFHGAISARGHIVRPEITIYKEDVVEVVSEVYLRDHLKISDGSVVELRILGADLKGQHRP